jgi:ABC-type transport system involved in cytochrome c biogenesis permease subunit
MFLQNITVLCFAASYTVALICELIQVLRPRRVLRWFALAACGAGLFAHSVFLVVQKLPLASESGSLFMLAWVLAVFSFLGSLNHRRLAWALFVLPVALAMVALGASFAAPAREVFHPWSLSSLDGDSFWREVHVGFFVLASIGICVAFIASCMYLVQARRLKNKSPAIGRVRLLSQERLESMHQRAIGLAFPFLTVGLSFSLIRMLQEEGEGPSWSDPRIISTLMLWIVFAALVYMRFGLRWRGRRAAQLTLVIFALLVLSLATSHHGPVGGVR